MTHTFISSFSPYIFFLILSSKHAHIHAGSQFRENKFTRVVIFSSLVHSFQQHHQTGRVLFLISYYYSNSSFSLVKNGKQTGKFFFLIELHDLYSLVLFLVMSKSVVTRVCLFLYIDLVCLLFRMAENSWPNWMMKKRSSNPKQTFIINLFNRMIII